MLRKGKHIVKPVMFTFKRWSNKGYSAFYSLGKLIRIGRLKVVMSAGLSSKSKKIKRTLRSIYTVFSFSMPGDGVSAEEEPGFLIHMEAEPAMVLVYTGYRGKQPERSKGRKFKRPCKTGSALLSRSIPLLASLLLFWIGNLLAQSDTTIVLSEVSITGNRIVIPFNEASRNISVVERKQMDILPVHSLPEVLAYVPGVDIRQRGPTGVQADISIRGGTFEQTLTLINGIKMTDPQTGHHMLSLPINLDDVRRIEVLKGPGARLYGQNAFAGAVNFITGIPARRQVTFRGYGGSFGSFGGGLTIAIPKEKYSQFLSSGGDMSGGYRYNTDYKMGKLFYQSELVLPGAMLSLTGGWTGRKFGANGFYASPDYHDQYEEVRTFFTSVTVKKEAGKLKHATKAYWRGNRDRYLLVRNDPRAYENFHRTNVLGLEWNGSMETRAGITGVGMEYRREIINGNWVRNGEERKSNLDGYSRDQAGLYLEQKIKVGGHLDIGPGIYVSWYSDFGCNVFPGLDIGYGINRHWRVYANAGKSYRVPTFYDQYYQSPAERGDPGIQPEKAWTYEAGLKYGSRGLSTEANIFYRTSDDLIDWVYSKTDSIWEAANIRSGRTLGCEFSFLLDFNARTGEDQWLEQISFSYNYIDNRLGDLEGIQSRYALANIRHQLIAGFNVRIFKRLKNSFTFRFIDRIDQDPYVLLDNRLYWEQSKDFSIFVEATNLTNQFYTEVMTPMPGRWIRAGIKWGMGF